MPTNLTFNLKALITYKPTSFVHCISQISRKVVLLLSFYLHCCFLPLCCLTTSLPIVFQKCLFLARLILYPFLISESIRQRERKQLWNEFANSGKYHCTALHSDIILRATEGHLPGLFFLLWSIILKNLLGQLQSAEICQYVKRIPPPSICKTPPKHPHTPPKHPQPFEATPTLQEKSMLVICHILIYMP